MESCALLLLLQLVLSSILYSQVEADRNASTGLLERKGTEVRCIDLWENDEVTIRSPRIGEKGYRSKVHITYHIMAPPKAKISFRCPHFRLQVKDPFSGKCTDYVEVPPAADANNDRRSSSSTRKKFCGLDIPNHLFMFNPIAPDQNNIVFLSDHGGTGSAFRCVLRKKMAEQDSTYYVNLVTSPKSLITSPETKQNSRTQIQGSTFSIVAPSKTRAILSCSEFSIRQNWKCMQEYLMINGVRYCGSRAPKNVLLYITPDVSDLIYYADNVDSPGSFKCTIDRLQGDEDSCSTPSKTTYMDEPSLERIKREVPSQAECIDLITSEKTIIQSTNFGFGNYTVNTKTDQQLMAPIASTITMLCHNFSLELSHWCKKDHLAIHSELWPLVRYCGEAYKGRQSLEERNVISFLSDGDVTGEGFRCTLQNHLVQVDHLVNLMATNETWIAYNARGDVGRWFNSRKQEVYVIVAPENSVLNISCPVFNVGCRYSEDLHVGTKLYGDSLCDSTVKSVQVPYNLANNTVVFTDDLRTSSNFFCTVTRTGGDTESCAFPGTDAGIQESSHMETSTE